MGAYQPHAQARPMAIYYLGMKSFGRARGKGGSRATSAAAYRAGERIRDERTGAVYDHRRRRDVLHKEIILPSRLTGAERELGWARARASLWNAAERAERPKNARVAREFTLGLPHELTGSQRTELARRFAQELSDRYHNAVDLVIHAPRGDPRNFHAHLLATTREIAPSGLGAKTTLELSGRARHALGLPKWSQEISAIRERWVDLANDALRAAHVRARIEYRTFGSLSTARELSSRLPLAAYHIERRGGRSFVAERIRELHRTRIAAAARAQAHRPDDAAREAARRWLGYHRERRAARGLEPLKNLGLARAARSRESDLGL